MNVTLTPSDIINVVLCILSFILAAISVITVVVTLRQNSKMIESSTRPYLVIYGQVANFQNPSFYLVLKNFGQSAATIHYLNCDQDLKDYAYHTERTPLGCLEGVLVAPQQKILCNLDPQKMVTKNLEKLSFEVKYSSGTKVYTEHYSVSFEAFRQNVQTRAATQDKELKIISYTLQDMVEKIM